MILLSSYRINRHLISRSLNTYYYTSIRTTANIAHKNDDQSPSAMALLKLAKPEWRLLSVGFAALVTGTAAQIAIPIGFSAMVDSATAGNVIGNLPTVPILNLPFLKENLSFPTSLASLFVITGVANAARIQCFAMASARLVMRLRQKLFDQILNQPMSFFDKNRSGGLVSRLSNDVYVMSDAISGETVMNGIRHSVQLVSTSAVMVYISPSLSCILLAIGPAVAGSGYFYGRYVKRISSEVQRSLGAASATAEERFSAIRMVKAFTAELYESQLYRKCIVDVYDNSLRYARATSVFNLFTSMVGNVSLLSVLAYGSYLIGTGHLTAGQLTAFGLYTLYFGISIVGLSKFWGDFMKGIGSSQHVWALLNQPMNLNAEPLKPLLIPNQCFGRIQMKNVTFRYPARPTLHILDNVSLNFEPNSITALVGESGSGKSTLIWLLLKLYQLKSGSILLDGIEIDTIDSTWIRQQIGIVSQDSAIFYGTVADNIRYGLPTASMDQIENAARTAQAYEFVQSLPLQFQTIIGQNGVDLSGGQRQRLAIARAILKNAPVLILDEATSALDAQNERLINNALETVLKSRTTILIAHRPSTFKKANRIVLLKEGHVAGQGTYDELIADPTDIGRYFRNLIQHNNK